MGALGSWYPNRVGCPGLDESTPECEVPPLERLSAETPVPLWTVGPIAGTYDARFLSLWTVGPVAGTYDT